MPGIYKFSDNLLIIAMGGEHTSEEFIAVLEKALKDPACPERVSLLIDGCKASFNPSPNELRELVDRMAEYGDKVGRRALVAGDDLLFGLGRMAGVFEDLHGKEMQVFKDVEKAQAWLLEE